MDPALVHATLRWVDEHNDRGVFTTDADLRIQSWNGWLEINSGITASEALGRLLLEVVPSLADRGLDQYYAEALAGEIKILSQTLHRYVIPMVLPGTGEQMPQRGQIGPLADEGRVIGTITVIEDVSERVATERELRARIAASEKARATAEAASRVKDEFLATLSHEIRTPLNAVLGWTRILKSREFDVPTVRRAIEVIDRNASAQLTLISDMLDMARISAGKVRLDMSDVDIASVALAAIDVVRPAADAKGVTLITDMARRVPSVSADQDRLLQIIWNLLSNAVKFTERGGTVTLSLAAQNHHVRLAVSDTGQGIAPEFLPQVFERFKQADASSARRHGGLGLGLALVRELVELHGGSVHVKSDGLGLGSTFTVQLPARIPIKSTPSKPDMLRRQDLETPLSGVHVLVVDDDSDAREIISRSVMDVGASVTAVSSVAEALAVLRNRSDHVDVVVTDIGMPGEDGYNLLREMRKLPSTSGGTLPAIAVTAYATAEDKRRALSAGFEAHLAKPVAPRTLISTIARAVAGRTTT